MTSSEAQHLLCLMESSSQHLDCFHSPGGHKKLTCLPISYASVQLMGSALPRMCLHVAVSVYCNYVTS